LELRPTQGGTSLTASIVARFDLFSGFDTIWQKRETEAKLLRSEAQLKNALLTAITDTEVAYRKIKTIQARVDLEEENATRSDRYYKAVMSEYKRGVKNSADLKVAAEQLYEIHLRQESYKYDFLNERISLERALGGRVETEMVKEQHEHKAN
jgi:outer membrane protein TolC